MKYVLEIESLTNVDLQVFQEMKDGKLKYVDSISFLCKVRQVVSHISRAVLNVQDPRIRSTLMRITPEQSMLTPNSTY